MGCKVHLLRKLFTILLFLSILFFAWSMLAGTFLEEEVTQGEFSARKLIAARVKHLELMAQGRRSSGFNEELDINYVSRRRIPTGPDPIHNRRYVRLRVPPARH